MEPPDVVVTETDPFFLGLLGKRLKKKGSRFIAYLQDIYPDIAVACGKAKEGFLIKKLRRWLFGAYAAADRVVVLSRDMQERCIENGVLRERIRVIPNWSDVENLYPIKEGNAFRREHQLDDKFVVMYSGNMGVPHLLEPVLDAAERLKNEPDIEFLFVGGGVQKRRSRNWPSPEESGTPDFCLISQRHNWLTASAQPTSRLFL